MIRSRDAVKDLCDLKNRSSDLHKVEASIQKVMYHFFQAKKFADHDLLNAIFGF